MNTGLFIRRIFCLRPPSIAVNMVLLGGLFGTSERTFAELYFDPEALRAGNISVTGLDLSIFEQGGQLPGTYRVDVYLNSHFVETRNISFVLLNNVLRPELTVQDWLAFGIDGNAVPALAMLPPETVVTAPEKFIPDATSRFKITTLRLDISLPQASLLARARQTVDPSRWDSGLPSFLMNYSLSAGSSHQRQGGSDNRNLFAGLNPGLNVGPWRLRNYSTWVSNTQKSGDQDTLTKSNDQNYSQWDNVYSFLQRDIHRLRSQLTMGQSASSGDVFDSFQFTGIKLASDDSMLPDSLRGFAPVVRGIAASDAQVTIRQNGGVIYQSYVAPGAFAISDLYPTSSSGNLEITVREADGTERTFIQAFSSVPGMQREGHLRYSATVGEYRSGLTDSRTPVFMQSTLQYGMSNKTTVYGGALLSGDYQSGVLGLAQGLGTFGSLSLDVTQAKTTLAGEPGSTHQGQSYRMQYAKDVFQSGTTFTLAGYRYSTAGFYDFTEANEIIPGNSDHWQRSYNKRSRFQVQVSQNLGSYGSLNASAYQQDYWRLAGKEQTITAGYSVSHNGITYGLSYAETQTPQSRSNRQAAFSVQVPLSRWLNGSYANYSLAASRDRVSNTVGLNGTALGDNQLSYSARQSHGTQGEGNQSSLNAGYKGRAGNVRGSYSYSDHYQQATLGLDGSIVVHPYGVTLSQTLAESSVLVRAPDAAGVQIQNHTGVKTDGNGFAVVPFASSYKENRVALDTASVPDNVDIERPVQTVVPTSGALVLAEFRAITGARVLLRLKKDGLPVPFGATAVLSAKGRDDVSGIVGDGGELYLSGVTQSARLKIKWGNGAARQCSTQILLPETAAGVNPLQMINATCR